MQQLLRNSSGLAATVLGDIDFTGQAFPEEPLAVFRPCLCLAIDGAGRRWIAETTHGDGLPGPVWCVVRTAPVCVWIDADLAGFLSRLRDACAHGTEAGWFHTLDLRAQWLWQHKRTLGTHFRNLDRHEAALRGWLLSLPAEAYVYDLRQPMAARGVPYGFGQLYRCGRLPVFAIAPDIPTR
ncbi:MAG TPA: hypothetical protein VHI52_14885 [Verrucomicrobiae bacterium]|nr:hypothetical protein [Verrucomicrobiae bacterium]